MAKINTYESYVCVFYSLFFFFSAVASRFILREQQKYRHFARKKKSKIRAQNRITLLRSLYKFVTGDRRRRQSSCTQCVCERYKNCKQYNVTVRVKQDAYCTSQPTIRTQYEYFFLSFDLSHVRINAVQDTSRKMTTVRYTRRQPHLTCALKN